MHVVLVATRNPLNIGAAARAMSNFGFPRLRLVTPYEPAFREARSAVGASKVLASAEVYENVAEAVADCTLVVGTTAVRHRDLHHPIRRLEVGARLLRKHLASSRVALLFGSEKRGLARPEKQKAATAGEVERITKILLETLHASGYLDRRPVNDSEDRIRRLVRRLHLAAEDTDAWLGMLRQIVWKLRSEKFPGG